MGKYQFALELSRRLLCSSPVVDPQSNTPVACGECASCQLFGAQTHPDFLAIQWEKPGKAITVDQVRNVGEFLSLKSQLGRYQVVLIDPANAMNRFAANSLLKTLEEPSGDSLLILVTHRPDMLLPTIRSRCQVLHFEVPPPAQAQQWLSQALSAQHSLSEAQQAQLLALAKGAPLGALAAATEGTFDSYSNLLKSLRNILEHQADPVTEVKNWQQVEAEQALQWLYLWFCELIRLKSGINRADSTLTTGIANQDWGNRAAGISLKSLYAMLDKITQARRVVHGQVNLQLLFEDLLLSCSRMA